jgi:hypothetical protein
MSVETAETIIAIFKSKTDQYERFLRYLNGKLESIDRGYVLKNEVAWRFFIDARNRTAGWIERINYLRIMNPTYLDFLKVTSGAGAARGGDIAFQMAWARMQAQEAYLAHSARTAALNATASAAEGSLVAGAGTTVAAIVIPIVGMIAVQVALGAPYYQARERAKEEGYASGFAKGFITGLLQWELRFAIDRFWDNAKSRNPADEMMPTIRANSHNQGLMDGRQAGLAKDDGVKKSYLRALRILSNPSTAGWTSRSDDWMEQMRARQVQISYVIEMAVAARKYGILLVE